MSEIKPSDKPPIASGRVVLALLKAGKSVLSPDARFMILLLRSALHNSKYGYSFPSLEQLALAIGSKNKVLRIFEQLESVLPPGLLRKEKGVGRENNEYTIEEFSQWPESFVSTLEDSCPFTKRKSPSSSKTEPHTSSKTKLQTVVVVPEQNRCIESNNSISTDSIIKHDTLREDRSEIQAPFSAPAPAPAPAPAFASASVKNVVTPGAPARNGTQPPWNCDWCGKGDLDRRATNAGCYVFCPSTDCHREWHAANYGGAK